jgi:peroxiredoxin
MFPNLGMDMRFDPIKIQTTLPSEVDSLKKKILPYRFKKEYPKAKFINERLLREQKRDSITRSLINKPIPDFDAPDTEGITHRPKSYEGRVLVLHFWNFWDYSFDNEIPVLNELIEKYHREGLEILSFTDLELGESEKAILQKHPIHYPLIQNARSFMYQFIKLNYYIVPYIIIADKKGNMRYFYINGELNNKKGRTEYQPNGDIIEYISRDKNNKFGLEEKILSLLKEI